MFLLKWCGLTSEAETDNSDSFPGTERLSNSRPSAESKTVNVTDFTFMKLLSKGSFGKVILSEKNGTNDLRAVKVMKKFRVIEEKRAKYVMA